MVNLVDLIETEDTSITNPGGYFGPEVSPFGVVVDNRDDATHTPETEAEYKKRKKKKEDQLNPNVGPAGSKEKTEEAYTRAVSSIVSALLEDGPTGPDSLGGAEKLKGPITPKGTVGPISTSEKQELNSFPTEVIQKGIEVEMEHTTDRTVAMNIVLDHLKENPRYYEKLKAVEGKAPYSDNMF